MTIGLHVRDAMTFAIADILEKHSLSDFKVMRISGIFDPSRNPPFAGELQR